ncbi:hypothetical protein R6Q59_008228 [Mikania micrantha]
MGQVAMFKNLLSKPPVTSWKPPNRRIYTAVISFQRSVFTLVILINCENYEIVLSKIEKADVAHNIDFREGPTLRLLGQMVNDPSATKGYVWLIDLVKIGGMNEYDNTVWNGSLVATPDAPLIKYVTYYMDFVLELNKALAIDPIVEICQLPMCDGIALC